ncbi:hypothetical protein AAHW03_19535 [Klebsiella pneumoniae]|mgnify:CR=1 FL=1|nr:hypothetical protein [Klebsiella pneumoniae]HDZ3160556.1 hypothetical protein [Klebsiella pneumoniae]
MKFEEWLSQQDGVIEVDCGCVTTEAFYHWMRVAYEAGTLTNEGTKQTGNSPVIGTDLASGPDCSVEVRYVAPPGYVMVPKDLLSELRDWAHPEIEKYCEMWEGRRDSEFPALRKVIADADALLAAAPQPQNAPQNIPEIIPGWTSVSERMPDCWCRTCRPVAINDMRFVVCPECGNKRCPRANDHRNACTGSNEPGQEGSAYPADPQEVK